MLLMTLLQLKYIVKIVECGSMNEASMNCTSPSRR